MTITAQLLATLIAVNCEAYFAGRKSRRAWDTEQKRLWTVAAKRGVQLEVLKLAGPRAVPVPPYAVRKRLREATLKVGR